MVTNSSKYNDNSVSFPRHILIIYEKRAATYLSPEITEHKIYNRGLHGCHGQYLNTRIHQSDHLPYIYNLVLLKRCIFTYLYIPHTNLLVYIYE